jgi:mannosyltransferase
LKNDKNNWVDLREVSVVAPSLHPRYTGVSASLFSLFPYQTQHTSIAVLGPKIPSEISRISVRQVLRHGWSKPKQKAYRIWHARRNNDMVVGIFLKYILRQPWKLVFTWSGQRRQARLTRWFLRQMDTVIATSDAAASYLEVPATVINHGVDIERYFPAENREKAWSETLLPGNFGIGVFGRIRPEKGTDIFVKAMIHLLPKYPNVTAIITGLVRDEHQDFLDELKLLIINAGLKERIQFLGERPAHEMPLWFRRISLYVAPMRWEGFGLTPLEAMASGTAVVATKTGAAAKLISEGETGIIVPPDDLNALTNAIDAFLMEPQKAEEMGKAGRRKTVEKHNIAQEAMSIQAVYDKLSCSV